MAVDPNKFAPGFEERLSSLMNDCRSLEPVCFFALFLWTMLSYQLVYLFIHTYTGR